MIIPFEELKEDTLLALVESFILREGTDYGDDEVSLEKKTEQIIQQIKTGKILIVYSELHESCDLMPASQFTT
jgi:uncharacterized protein YheU (UPF0270 family)